MILPESIAIGLVFGFLFYEWIGFSAGGFVVPGYFALHLNNPGMVAGTLGVSLLAWGTVHLLSRVMILFGRRRFILTILAGFAWQWLFIQFIVRGHVLNTELDTIGFIIPGLIASEMGRQRVLPTLMMLIVVSVLVRLTLIALGHHL